MEESKPFWVSKMFWVNILAAVGLLIQSQTGFVIDLETQGAILIVVNLVLRAVTGQPISWR